LGWLNSGDVTRIVNLINKVKLPVNQPKLLNANNFLQLMSVDKKNVDGQIKLILLKEIGQATLPMCVEDSLIRTTIESYSSN
jgi:3-dehydroquinate synthase